MRLPSITAEQWGQVGALFDQLTGLAPSARDLDGLVCDPAVKQVLVEMLTTCDSDEASLLDQTLQRIAGQLLAHPGPSWRDDDFSGRRFGPWQAIETIGRGGMAVVLRGKRADGQFEKDVAIKLLPGTDDDACQRRLGEEIRILAPLEHPNIARLIDGGVDATGIRYLVMEHVQGQDLSEYCQSLDLESRLSLFEQAMDAVAYAHRHLVVHCDIKPGNILVSEEGQVRLVDFGIANLIEQGIDDPAAHRSWFCSPAYAAPEQLSGDPPSTAQDVFSLGAVLYELMTDVRLRNNQEATGLWLGRAPRPECVVPPRKIYPAISRDLEAICLRALANDSTDRYGSVDALREDLTRFRLRQPVAARDGGQAYRLGRFLSRNRWAVAATAAVIIVTIAGSISTHWQAQQARLQANQAQLSAEQALSESRRARASRDFLVQLFEANDPDVAKGAMPTARDLLDQGEFQVRNAFQDTPTLRAEMLVLLGELHRGLEERDTATRLLQEGLALADQHGLSDVIVKALHGLGTLHNQIGRHENALAAFEQAEELLGRYGRIPGPEHALLMQPMVSALHRVKGPERAIDQAREALLMARNDFDLPPATLHDYLIAAGESLLAVEQLDEAQALLEEAMALDLAEADTPSRRWRAHATLLHIAGRQGDIEAALRLSEQSVDLAEQVFPPLHLKRAEALLNLAISLCFQGRLAEAESRLNLARAIYLARDPERTHPQWATIHSAYGLILLHAERYPEARQHLAEARRRSADETSKDTLRYLMATSNLAIIMARMGEHANARQLAEESLALAAQVLPPNHHRHGWFQSVLAEAYLSAGRAEEALAHLDLALDLFRSTEFDEPVVNLYLRTLRAQTLAAKGQNDEARTAFEAAIEYGKAAGANAAMEWPRTLAAQSEFLIGLEFPDAREMAEHALSALHRDFGDNHPATLRVHRLIKGEE